LCPFSIKTSYRFPIVQQSIFAFYAFLSQIAFPEIN
jgi:hypothetical protein